MTVRKTVKKILPFIAGLLVILFIPNIVRAQTESIPGDANGDGRVDVTDYVVWLTHYEQNISGAANGNFNTDGVVDGLDYTIWLDNYGTSSASATPTPTAGGSSAIWWGDADTNGLDAWKNIQCPTGNGTVENDPLGRYGKVYRAHLGTGDIYSGDGKARCEYYGTVLPNGTYLKYYEGLLFWLAHTCK